MHEEAAEMPATGSLLSVGSAMVHAQETGGEGGEWRGSVWELRGEDARIFHSLVSAKSITSFFQEDVMIPMMQECFILCGLPQYMKITF